MTTKHLVVTNDQARNLREKLSLATEIGFDTEVSGPSLLDQDMVNVYASTFTGFSVAIGDDAYYVPVSHRKGTNCYDWRSIMSEIFRPAAGREIWAHNWQFDLKVVHRAGFVEVEDCQLRCSLVAGWLLRGARGTLELKELAKSILGMNMASFYDTVKGGQFDSLSPQEALSYTCDDALATLRLGKFFAPRMKQWDEALYATFVNLEMPFVRVLSHMETTGMPLDTETLLSLKQRIKPRADEIYESAYWELGIELGSGTQLSKWGFDGGHWGKEGIEETKKKGVYKTNVDALETVIANPKTSPLGRKVAEDVLEWRLADKLISTYTGTFVDQYNQYPDKMLHCSYNHTGTATGRLSCSGPNLQNIPTRTELGKTIREAFCAPPGWKFLSADYSQIELRVLAHLAGSGKLLEAFLEQRDLHQQTADIIGTSREHGKTFNFAVVYGAQDKRISKALGVTRPQAKDYISRFQEGYKEIAGYDEKVVEAARERGYVRTLARRFRKLPGIHSTNTMDRWAEERRARNTPVQGGARDVMTKAMVDIYEKLRKEGNLDKAKMACQIHDDIMFLVRDDFAEELSQQVKFAMENAWPLKCPLVTKPVVAQRWSDMK